MQITILANPRSGAGKALRLAEELDARLTQRGHTTRRPTLDRTLDLAAFAGGSDRVVIVGGDGTVHHLCGAAAALGVPIYHLATGTENLFARYFGMPRKPELAVHAIEQDHEPTRIDLGSANGVPFTLMCSLGVDASVIHRVEAVRGRKGGHAMYVLPSIAEGLRPRTSRLVIESGEPSPPARNGPEPLRVAGTVVVSNIPAYALRMDPCRGASPTDGLLDLAILPATTSLGTAWQLARCKLGSKRVRRLRADSFTISPTEPGARSYIQIDGERPQPDSPLPGILEGTDRLTLSIWPTRLAVHASTLPNG